MTTTEVVRTVLQGRDRIPIWIVMDACACNATQVDRYPVDVARDMGFQPETIDVYGKPVRAYVRIRY
jgi:hypothetical protein